MLEERFALPVRLENDAIAAMLGEWHFGAGRGHANVVYITVSTGIGGGAIVDGCVLRGRQGLAGHVGHMTIVRDGERCCCGNFGCWEAYGSGMAFAERARRGAAADATSTLRPMRHRSTVRPCSPRPRAAIRWRSSWLPRKHILGVGIASLLHLYSPEVVVMGGGMSVNFVALLPESGRG